MARNYTLETDSDKYHKIINIEDYLNENIDLSETTALNVGSLAI